MRLPWACEQFVQNRQNKGRRLACTRLGGADQVVPGEGEWNSRCLDGCWFVITRMPNP